MKNSKDLPIILTSIGFSNPKVLDYLVVNAPPKQIKFVAIVVTASRGKSSHQFAQLAYQQLKQSGYENIQFLDFDTDTENIKKFDLIYVCGGNTFYLNTSMHKNGYADDLREHILNGCSYVGVSAGTSILGRSLDILSKIDMDPCLEEDKKYSPLGLLPFDIIPHANILSNQQRDGILSETIFLNDHEALVCHRDTSRSSLNIITKITTDS
jgi:peptidase E